MMTFRATDTALPIVAYPSSLRSVPVAETAARAEALAAQLGISRVVDITRLDRVGIPVFASIRPTALPGSLCVNAGKGVNPPEARVGALMEAIEYALAEPGASPASPRIFSGLVRDVLDGHTRHDAILDLCPILGMPITTDSPLECVEAEEILSGGICILPANRIFLPAPRSQHAQPAFGYTSNGLASGNTRLEATVHALAEVIERDITSFQRIRNTAVRVRESSLPPFAAMLAERFREADLDLWIHCVTDSALGIPYFQVRIFDPVDPRPIFFNSGFGCHPHRSIALVRALCEAAQSRLSFIHGGRDDLDIKSRRIAERLAENSGAYDREYIREFLETGDAVDYETTPDHSAEAGDLDSCLSVMLRAVQNVGVRQVCRVVFTPEDTPLQVVKVIVPLMEEFDVQTFNVGRRLRDYVLRLQADSRGEGSPHMLSVRRPDTAGAGITVH